MDFSFRSQLANACTYTKGEQDRKTSTKWTFLYFAVEISFGSGRCKSYIAPNLSLELFHLSRGFADRTTKESKQSSLYHVPRRRININVLYCRFYEQPSAAEFNLKCRMKLDFPLKMSRENVPAGQHGVIATFTVEKILLN